MSDKIIYSILPPDEYSRLSSIFDELDWKLPNPALSVCVVAELNGEIILAGFLQSILHSEPFWIHPKMRGGKVDWKRAAGMLESQIGVMSPYDGVVIHARDKRAEGMAIKLGFEQVPGKLFRKVIERPKLHENGEDVEGDVAPNSIVPQIDPASFMMSPERNSNG